MPLTELPPYDPLAQRRVELDWHGTIAHGIVPPRTRAPIRDSWQRCLSSGIRPDLPRAPIVATDDALHQRRLDADWLQFAERAVRQLPGGFGEGHILSLFDADGCMLAGEGDAAALEGLAEINYRPGALWTEAAVGTNGPGTALAEGRPVHVVGAEHFCATWQRWHCAAVPVRDQVTGEVAGILDISGFRDYAHPHTLDLAIALGIAIEQMLAARDVERRFRIVQRYTTLALAWPGDAVVAVDRGGQVLGATASVPAGLRPESPPGAMLRTRLATLVGGARTEAPGPATLPLYEDAGLDLVMHPVLDGGRAVGACLVLAGAPRASATRRMSGGIEVPRPLAVASEPAIPARGARAGAATRYTFFDLAGESGALAEACRVAAAAASNALPVLLVGESGTGKEVFAQAIHSASARRGRPFVAVNCAALPRELVESELFGYVGGAFSGARREGSTGKFELADGGTLFLDEVGELPPAAQAALLRVLQEGEVQRVGGHAPRPVDVRVIAATNRDVAASLADGQLRRDLYYRLNVLAIELPPLRDRRGDVPILAARFLEQAEQDLGRPGHAWAPDALAALQAHDWPGNVRELKNLVRRLVALCPARAITAADLPDAVRAAAAPRAALRLVPPDAAPAADPERERTIRAVCETRTMTEAAAALGITRSTLYRRLERWGLTATRTVE